ncbi:MAG: septation protein SepH [Candidatus Nanopelagicales bacterium]
MRELSFMGPSNDGQRLLLVDADGTEFELVVDPRLVAVITREHGTTPRARAQVTPAAPLPTPREIQDRVRHGESVADIATEANVDRELIARFAHPVITERGHVSVQARAAHVLVGGERVSLEAAVSARVRIRAVDPLSIRWDAWRCSDGTWSVVAAYPAAQGDRIATFTYNQRDDSISAVDDEAMWLLERSSPPPPTNINDGPRHGEAPRGSRGSERPEASTPVPADSSQDSKPARAWDQSHPAARAAQRRESAAEASHPAGGATHRGADSAQPTADAHAVGRDAAEPDSKQVDERSASGKSPDSTPHWEELLFGSPKDDE